MYFKPNTGQNKNVVQAYLPAKNIMIKLRHRQTNSRRKGQKIITAPNNVLLRFFFFTIFNKKITIA